MLTSAICADTFLSPAAEDHAGAVSRGRYVVLQGIVGIILGF